MLRMTTVLFVLLAAGPGLAADAPPKQTARAQKVAANEAKATDAKANDAKADGATPKDAKTLAGISILGNQEAPKSLVIVPWKGSEIGDMPGLSRLLDDSVQPVDKDVFMRELSYYQIRQSH
ncbi:MAG: hypothetical protein ACREXP_10750 [Steroidobacteraceae bacterium]